MGNVWRVCKGYTPTWIAWQTEIDKMGIEIGKSPPWAKERSGKEPEEDIRKERTFHTFHFRLRVHFTPMTTQTPTHMLSNTHTYIRSACTGLVKTVEAVKYCRSGCSYGVCNWNLQITCIPPHSKARNWIIQRAGCHTFLSHVHTGKESGHIQPWGPTRTKARLTEHNYVLVKWKKGETKIHIFSKSLYVYRAQVHFSPVQVHTKNSLT